MDVSNLVRAALVPEWDFGTDGACHISTKVAVGFRSDGTPVPSTELRAQRARARRTTLRAAWIWLRCGHGETRLYWTKPDSRFDSDLSAVKSNTAMSAQAMPAK